MDKLRPGCYTIRSGDIAVRLFAPRKDWDMSKAHNSAHSDGSWSTRGWKKFSKLTRGTQKPISLARLNAILARDKERGK